MKSVNSVLRRVKFQKGFLVYLGTSAIKCGFNVGDEIDLNYIYSEETIIIKKSVKTKQKNVVENRKQDAVELYG